MMLTTLDPAEQELEKCAFTLLHPGLGTWPLDLQSRAQANQPQAPVEASGEIPLCARFQARCVLYLPEILVTSQLLDDAWNVTVRDGVNRV